MTSVAQRITRNHIGVIGLFAWSAILVTTLASQIAAGSKAFAFILTPLGYAVQAACTLSGSAPSLSVRFAIYLAAFILSAVSFAWAFWCCTARPEGRESAAGAALILAQMVLALGCESQLLLLVAAELAFVLPSKKAVVWLAGQMVAYAATQAPALLGIDRLPPLDLLGETLDRCMALVWLVMAFGIGSLAAFERRARIKLAVAHSELIATRQLLDDTLRSAERARISRNLHDAIGHHLTALNLHLELGLRQAGAESHASLKVARKLAHSLLAEVREVVHVERTDSLIDLRKSLAALCAGIPYPAIALRYKLETAVEEPNLAHALYRVVQECITNAIRHANPSTIAVSVEARGGGIVATIRDNGHGAVAIREGSGLQGMRRRIEELSGTLRIKVPPNGGVDVYVWLPIGSMR